MKKKILLADDSPSVRRVISMSLEMEGYEVESVCNGEEALQKLAISHPDVLITDISMPKMNGRELCHSIHNEYPERQFRIYVITANVGRDEREWVSQISNIDFLEKPVSPRRLQSQLADYFADGETQSGR